MAQENDTYYKYGFNDGYHLKDTAPDLADLLSLVPSNDEYLNGFKDGRAEKDMEHEQERLNELDDLRTDRSSLEKDQEY